MACHFSAVEWRASAGVPTFEIEQYEVHVQRHQESGPPMTHPGNYVNFASTSNAFFAASRLPSLLTRALTANK